MGQFWPRLGADSGWQTVTLSAGWTALGSPNRGAVARARDGIGYVSLTATNAGAVSAGAVVGVLPVGCRPSAVVHATARSTGLVALVTFPSGDIQTATAISAAAGVFGSFSFPLD